MANATCASGFRYPIAACVTMGRDRRIRLPRFLEMATPYVLVENVQAGQTWLGFCRLDSLSHLMATCDSLRVVAEYRTCRPTIPEITCYRHALQENISIWLLITDSVIEILPDSACQAEDFTCG